jgi:hypothetical protein
MTRGALIAPMARGAKRLATRKAFMVGTTKSDGVRVRFIVLCVGAAVAGRRRS